MSKSKKTELPFSELNYGYKKVIRRFDAKIEPSELKWHTDAESRLVTTLNDTNWEFQFEDCIPFQLKKGQMIYIPKGVHHRVIKPKKKPTQLIIEVIKE